MFVNKWSLTAWVLSCSAMLNGGLSKESRRHRLTIYLYIKY
ncbi:hypothetical protein XM38_004830 [Halomicronema hongdechloris C2206]|uniref:Uncharacterized protein n=1 Tax=Halomicronema hongdechloris C2206 TaxID=1641165 RepID=A0A1Z3HGY6_9CYAN|nr:hypothetical protein XM38_004830 [Halomicronema hongdechloris C2206]